MLLTIISPEVNRRHTKHLAGFKLFFSFQRNDIMMHFSNLPMLALLAKPIIRANFYSYAIMDKPPMKAPKQRSSS